MLKFTIVLSNNDKVERYPANVGDLTDMVHNAFKDYPGWLYMKVETVHHDNASYTLS
jgi:hypothetical protein